jgi:hypothetical protein
MDNKKIIESILGKSLKKFCDKQAKKMLKDNRDLLSKYIVIDNILYYTNSYFAVYVKNVQLANGAYNFDSCELEPLDPEHIRNYKILNDRQLSKFANVTPYKTSIPNFIQNYSLYLDKEYKLCYKTDTNYHTKEWIDILLFKEFIQLDILAYKETQYQPLKIDIEFNGYTLEFAIMPLNIQR